MADEFTPNYNFFLPKEEDSMADVKKNITDSFKIIQPRNDITIIPAGQPLPQAGNYNLGDRVFRDDPAASPTYPSNYILVCKDLYWGWHWRPIQGRLSPWVDIPNTAVSTAYASQFGLTGVSPVQIALDNRGICYWRGKIKSLSPTIPVGISMPILRNVPVGIRPNSSITFTCGLGPLVAGNTFAASQFHLDNTGNSMFDCINSDNGLYNSIWLESVRYNNAYLFYYDA